MESLAAGGFQETAQLERLDDGARHLGGAHEITPREVFVRIEIERDAVGMLHVGAGRAPGVQLHRAVLHQREQRAVRVDVDIVALARALALEGLHVSRARAHRKVALVEALFLGTVGTAHQRERPPREVRQDALGDAVVVAREIELRDAEARPDEALGVRDLDPMDRIVAFHFGRPLRLLLGHRLRRQVFAQPEERSLPQDAVVGALGERDLRHELRLHPLHSFLTRRVDEGRVGTLQRCQAARQRGEPVLVETGAHLARVLELAAGRVVHAEQQRAEAGPRAARRGVADDHEVLLLAALELDPGLGAARLVDRIGALADQPLEPELARLVEHLGRVAFQVLAEANALRWSRKCPPMRRRADRR